MTICLFSGCTGSLEKKDSMVAKPEIRDLIFFLNRLVTLDHLPELEASHTALSSTWDTSGMNNDGNFYKCITDTVNILLDMDGPGCIHRIFTGYAYFQTQGTRLQIYTDGHNEPVFDIPCQKNGLSLKD
jgi:hypothetical protein